MFDEIAAKIKLKEHTELTYPVEAPGYLQGNHASLSAVFFNNDTVIRFLKDGLYISEGAIKRGRKWLVRYNTGYEYLTNTEVRNYMRLSDFMWRQIT